MNDFSQGNEQNKCVFFYILSAHCMGKWLQAGKSRNGVTSWEGTEVTEVAQGSWGHGLRRSKCGGQGVGNALDVVAGERTVSMPTGEWCDVHCTRES